MINKMNHNFYVDLVSDIDRVQAYQHPDTFKYDPGNEGDIQILKRIQVEETELERYSKDDDCGFDRQFKELAATKVLVTGMQTVALFTGAMLEPVNRLRSYRGFLDKELKEDSQYIEQEVVISEGLSIFGGMILVNNANAPILLDQYFGGSSTRCFIQSKNEMVFRSDLLNYILTNCMIHKQTSVINYFALRKFLNKQEQIIRIAGHGFRDLSIQVLTIAD